MSGMMDTENYPQMQWGCTYLLPIGLRCAWGARAILKHGEIDLLWDRQMMFGSDEDRKELAEWLNTVALPELRETVKKYHNQGMDLNKEDPAAWAWPQDSSGIVFGDCNESYGYMYLAGFMTKHLPEGHPTLGAERMTDEWDRRKALKGEAK